jgi:hypothetical protein
MRHRELRIEGERGLQQQLRVLDLAARESIDR